MAFTLKNTHRPQSSSIQPVVIDQWIKVVRDDNAGAGVNLPTAGTATGRIFRVWQGKVLIRALIGVVTTAIQAQADNVKVSVQKLTAAGVASGTAVDIAANVDVTGLEAGGHYFVEGDGTAGVLSNAGGVLIGTNSGSWIAEGNSQIYITASATNTGKVRWELWYQPIDAGAYVTAEALASGLLQAKL